MAKNKIYPFSNPAEGVNFLINLGKHFGMKILQLCKKFPYPLKDGESVAIYNLAKGLKEGGAEMHLFCINTEKHYFDPADLPSQMNPYHSITAIRLDTAVTWYGALLNLFSGKSYHIQRFFSKKVETALCNLLQKTTFDVVQLEGIHLALYEGAIRRYSGALISLRAHNLEYQIWERVTNQCSPGLKKLYLNLLTSRLKHYEVEVLKRQSFLVPISDRDMANFRKLGFKGKSCLCPIGVDPEQYNYSEKDYDTFEVSFLGAMDWLPNREGIRWFMAEVWPAFRRMFPDAQLHVAGRNMPESWRSSPEDGIFMHGEVPDARAFLAAYPLMVVPLFSGSGMRAKIIEAMALARCVLTTPLGLEGIPAINNISVCLAGSISEFVSELSVLAGDLKRVRQIGEGGRKLILEHFQSSAIAEKLILAYQDWLEEGFSEQKTGGRHG